MSKELADRARDYLTTALAYLEAGEYANAVSYAQYGMETLEELELVDAGKCLRCEGRGRVPMYHGDGSENGTRVCTTCQGTGLA